ncbi:MAG: LTA synthase family protein [Clostridia bacterium]|nr:LTA synthase family protein [Clostridia bacterium]
MKQLLLKYKDKLVSFWKGILADEKSAKHLKVISCTSLICVVFFLLTGYHFFYALFWGAVVGTVAFSVSEKYYRFLSVFLWLLGPFLCFLTVEYMIGNVGYFPFYCNLYTPQEILLNLIWYYMAAVLLYLIFGRLKASAIATVVIFLVIGLTDSYFFAFRGRVLFPSDFMALRTAVNVIGEYNFLPSVSQLLGTLTMIGYLIGLCLIPTEKGARRPKWFVSLATVALSAGYIFLFFYTPFLTWTGFEAKLWTSLWQTKQNGVVLNFTVNLRFSSVEKPDGYDELIGSYVDGYTSSEAVLPEGTVRPNVIVIMNESFCDLSVIGIETNEPCIPFIDSLTENTIKGYTYVSVFSGHTANSEYEFLTGNSISYLPIGTVAYQMFTQENDYSLARQLNSLGYHSIAMHPYDSSGWNRISVYNRYDFDEMYFIEDFKNVTNIREYCSDRSNYENVISKFEEHRKGANGDKPLFLFNITMQNHGGYSVNWSGLEKTVWLTGDLEGKYESVDMYLSLARESDAAFEELLGYFASVSEPTVIVMFGDHHPGLADTFYTDVFGQKKDTLSQEDSVCLYQVPYVIWANYDIEEKEYGNFSLNYLSTVLTDAMGYPKTGYQQFLWQSMKSLPVITRNFYQDAAGKWSGNPADLSTDAQNMIAKYAVLQYNGLKGGSSRRDEFFNLLRE